MKQNKKKLSLLHTDPVQGARKLAVRRCKQTGTYLGSRCRGPPKLGRLDTLLHDSNRVSPAALVCLTVPCDNSVDLRMTDGTLVSSCLCRYVAGNFDAYCTFSISSNLLYAAFRRLFISIICHCI